MAKKTIVTCWISEKILKQLDDFAQKAKISRSQLIHNCIETGYDEIKIQNNLGIIKFTLSIDRIKSKVSELLFGAKEKNISIDPDPKGTNLSLRIDPDLIQKIDDLGQKIGMNRSIFIEYILEISIKGIKYINIPVILDAGLLLRDIKETIERTWKKSFEESEKAIKEEKIVTKLERDENHN